MNTAKREQLNSEIEGWQVRNTGQLLSVNKRLNHLLEFTTAEVLLLKNMLDPLLRYLETLINDPNKISSNQVSLPYQCDFASMLCNPLANLLSQSDAFRCSRNGFLKIPLSGRVQPKAVQCAQDP
jgi:hypothetical protein